MDTHNIESMDDLRTKISGMIRRYNNLPPGERKGQASAFSCEVKQYELMLKYFRSKHEMENKEDLKALIEEVEELKRSMTLKAV